MDELTEALSSFSLQSQSNLVPIHVDGILASLIGHFEELYDIPITLTPGALLVFRKLIDPLNNINLNELNRYFTPELIHSIYIISHGSGLSHEIIASYFIRRLFEPIMYILRERTESDEVPTIFSFDVYIALNDDIDLLSTMLVNAPIDGGHFVVTGPTLEPTEIRSVLANIPQTEYGVYEALENMLEIVAGALKDVPGDTIANFTYLIASQTGRQNELAYLSGKPRYSIDWFYELQKQILKSVILYSEILQPHGILEFETIYQAMRHNPYLIDIEWPLLIERVNNYYATARENRRRYNLINLYSNL